MKQGERETKRETKKDVDTTRMRQHVRQIPHRRAFELATRVVEQWRAEGFESVGCYPNGVCYPANMGMLPSVMSGQRHLPIASDEAIIAVARAIESGANYRLKSVA